MGANRRFMMATFDLSIVIPVHNVASSQTDYLGLFQSRFRQRYGDLRVQIVIVDDASTDCSAEVIRDLAAGFGPTTLVQLSSNVGPGVARNAGLDVAAGEFVLFADADDSVELDVLLRSITRAREMFADVMSLGYAEEWTPLGRRKVPAQPTSSVSSLITRRAAVWRFLFRREFLIRRNLVFPNLYYAEDVVFMLRVAEARPHVTWHNECAYVYRRHGAGLSGSRPEPSRAALALQELTIFESVCNSPALVALSRAWRFRIAFRARAGLARTHPLALTKAGLAVLASPLALRQVLKAQLASREEAPIK